MTTRSGGRTSRARWLAWLAVAGLTTAALFAPATVSADDHVTITNPEIKNPSCEDLGYSLEFKIDTGDLENKTYTLATPKVTGNWTGQEITLSNVSGDGQTFDWSATIAVWAVLVKAGDDNHALYTYDSPATSDSGLTKGADQQGISHVSFCGNAVVPTPTPTDEPTPTPTEEPTPTPTEEPTPTPTVPPTEEPTPTPTVPPTEEPTPTPTPEGSVAPTESTPPTDAPTATPTGDVGGATGTPATTLPPTDALDGTSSPGESWRLIVLAMAGILAAALLLTPARVVRTADRD
jgi:hypothetical protein